MHIKVTGADRIISKLKTYRNSLREKQEKLMLKLAEIGIDTATIKFGSAQYDGENDVEVSRLPQWSGDNTLIISATGQAVTFIEFGTGVHYTELHPVAVDLGMIRGKYGQGKGSRDGWGYIGSPGTNGVVVKESPLGTVVVTHGNPPARAMYDAGKDMRERIVEVAKEVFKDD